MKKRLNIYIVCKNFHLLALDARGVNAIYEEVKKQGKTYNNKTKTGFTLAKIKQWYESREKVQSHKGVQTLSQFHTRTTQTTISNRFNNDAQSMEK